MKILSNFKKNIFRFSQGHIQNPIEVTRAKGSYLYDIQN
jgi:hypothetical protein